MLEPLLAESADAEQHQRGIHYSAFCDLNRYDEVRSGLAWLRCYADQRRLVAASDSHDDAKADWQRWKKLRRLPLQPDLEVRGLDSWVAAAALWATNRSLVRRDSYYPLGITALLPWTLLVSPQDEKLALLGGPAVRCGLHSHPRAATFTCVRERAILHVWLALSLLSRNLGDLPSSSHSHSFRLALTPRLRQLALLEMEKDAGILRTFLLQEVEKAKDAGVTERRRALEVAEDSFFVLSRGVEYGSSEKGSSEYGSSGEKAVELRPLPRLPQRLVSARAELREWRLAAARLAESEEGPCMGVEMRGRQLPSGELRDGQWSEREKRLAVQTKVRPLRGLLDTEIFLPPHPDPFLPFEAARSESESEEAVWEREGAAVETMVSASDFSTGGTEVVSEVGGYWGSSVSGSSLASSHPPSPTPTLHD